MTRSRVLVLLFSLCLGIGLVPSVSEATTPPAAQQQLAGPGYHEPAVGLCYDLTTKQANKVSATQDAVPCDAPHTLMTVKVKRLSKPVRWTAVYSRIVVSCYEALYDVLGSAKLAEMSSYDLWWFIPTKEERAQGARWARCDVGLHKGTSGLGKLPTSVALGWLAARRQVRPVPGRQGPQRHLVPDVAQAPCEGGVQAGPAGLLQGAVPQAGPTVREAHQLQPLCLRRPVGRGVEGRQPLHGLLQARLSVRFGG